MSLACVMTTSLRVCEPMACVISVSLLRLAHAAQEMPEWERWGNNWSRNRREKLSRASVPMCLFWQYPPCVRACVCPAPTISTHARIWTCSHFGGPCRGNQTFLPFVRNAALARTERAGIRSTSVELVKVSVSSPQLEEKVHKMSKSKRETGRGELQPEL